MAQAMKKIPPEHQVEIIAREFEDFVYIVSHDLGAPLRHIREFTRLMIEARGLDSLDQEEMEYVHFLEVSLEKMDKIQQALLEYSRVSTRAGPSQTIEPSGLIEEALRILKRGHAKDSEEIEYEALPKIYADPVQAQSVFLYILDNAFKFQATGATPKIQIKADIRGDITFFEIADNGIGIDQAHVQEVFRLFRKLHTAETFPGVGAGLTVVKKIVERHGGEIYLESEIGRGTRIFFSLPAAE